MLFHSPFIYYILLYANTNQLSIHTVIIILIYLHVFRRSKTLNLIEITVKLIL